MTYSLILPYYKRLEQLEKTFESYWGFYKNRNDYEIILVEDYKNQLDLQEHHNLLNLIGEWDCLNIIRIMRPEELTYNPARAYNHGVNFAIGKFIILTSPEVVHKSDVLNQLDKYFEENPNNYYVGNCNSDVGFYQGGNVHKCLHFISAISKENYWKAGGFNEEFSQGYAFEDNDWILRVYHSGIKVVEKPEILTYHISHSPVNNPYGELYEKNRQLFYSLWKVEERVFPL